MIHEAGLNLSDYPLSNPICLLGFFAIASFEKLILGLHARFRENKSRCNDILETRDSKNQIIDQYFQQQDTIPTTGDVLTEVVSTSHESEQLDTAKSQSLVLMGALSLECIFDGLSIGLQLLTTRIWKILIDVLFHKFIIAFCLGLELMHYHSKRKMHIFAGIYSNIPSFGCPVGIIITESSYDISDHLWLLSLEYSLL